MILTPLVRAQHHAKRGNLNVWGQVYLAVYTLFLVGTKLAALTWMMASIDVSTPGILLGAILPWIFTNICHFRLVYAFNDYWVPSFEKGPKVTPQKFIHVLINCIAVMPFRPRQEDEDQDQDEDEDSNII